MMDHCLFCKIANGEIPSEKVYEDDAAFAFLDIQPRSPGHTMVIPKTHVASILDFPDKNIGPFFTSVKRVTQMIEKALAPDGFTMGINHGKAAGQVIEHFHFHIIPRWKSDGGRSIHSVVDNPPKEDLETMAKKIRGEV